MPVGNNNTKPKTDPDAPGFYLYTSNQLQLLAEALAALLRERPGGVFTPDTIVIQSRGIERWLSLQLAEYNGICANFKPVFPRGFVHNVLLGQNQPPGSGKAGSTRTCRRLVTVVLSKIRPSLRMARSWITSLVMWADT